MVSKALRVDSILTHDVTNLFHEICTWLACKQHAATLFECSEAIMRCGARRCYWIFLWHFFCVHSAGIFIGCQHYSRPSTKNKRKFEELFAIAIVAFGYEWMGCLHSPWRNYCKQSFESSLWLLRRNVMFRNRNLIMRGIRDIPALVKSACGCGDGGPFSGFRFARCPVRIQSFTTN